MESRPPFRQILLELLENNKGEPVERFDEDMNLRTDLGLDSVDMITPGLGDFKSVSTSVLAASELAQGPAGPATLLEPAPGQASVSAFAERPEHTSNPDGKKR